MSIATMADIEQIARDSFERARRSADEEIRINANLSDPAGSQYQGYFNPTDVQRADQEAQDANY